MISKHFKFSAFSLELQKFFSITRTIFLTVFLVTKYHFSAHSALIRCQLENLVVYMYANLCIYLEVAGNLKFEFEFCYIQVYLLTCDVRGYNCTYSACSWTSTNTSCSGGSWEQFWKTKTKNINIQDFKQIMTLLWAKRNFHSIDQPNDST